MYKLEIMEGWIVFENGVKSIFIVLNFCYQCLNREYFFIFKKKRRKLFFVIYGKVIIDLIFFLLDRKFGI